MSKRKTKKQKIKSQARRLNKVVQPCTKPIKPGTKEVVTLTNNRPSPQNETFKKYLKHDLQKTLIVTVLVIAILIALASTQNQWVQYLTN